MPTRGFLTIQDYNQEVSTMTFWVQDIGAGNYASVTQDIDEVKDAVATMIRGVILESGFTKVFPESFAVPSNADAQRETKWLVTYRDTTQFLDVDNSIANPGYGKIFNAEIGTALLNTTILTANSDFANLAESTIVAPFVAVFEANVRSPYNHTATSPSINVLSIEHVGRNT